MIYKASWDTITKIVTIGVTVLFIAIPLGPYSPGLKGGQPAPYIIALLMFLIYFISYAFRPVDYRITSENLIIHRPLKDVVISRSQIASVELLPDEKLKWSFRTFGVGGLFGFYGKFYNTKIGHMTWYATRRKRAVLVKTFEGKNIILTPDDADDFVNQLEANHSLSS